MYRRRIKIFMALMVVVLAGLIWRLGYLQLVKGEQFREQAALALQTEELLPARRGRILDRNGEILALDQPCFDFCLDYRFLTGNKDWARSVQYRLRRRRGLSREQAAREYARLAENTWKLARSLAEEAGVDLTYTVSRIQERVEAMRDHLGFDIREQRQAHPVVPGLDEALAVAARTQLDETVGASVRPSHKRYYPHGSTACHIIGITGNVTAEEQKALNLGSDQAGRLERMRHNYLAWDKIGKSGVEKMSESHLRGVRGYRRLMQGTEQLEGAPAEAGQDVYLTLDIKLQRVLTERMEYERRTGAIVVLDVRSGEVLAMVSVPTFDLNRFYEIAGSLYKDQVDFKWLNRAVAYAYPPGSTVKPISAVAALGSGKFNTTEKIYCRGYLHRPGSFRCYHSIPHGDVDVRRSLKKSCNVFYYTVADRIGRDELIYWFTNLGFGQKPGTGLPEESAGTVPTSSFIRQRYGRPPVPADGRFMAIGQGGLTATPLQVANAIASVARGGKYLSPVLAVSGGPEQVSREMPIPAEHAALIRDGMWAVVNEQGGTAYRVFRHLNMGVEICGKTGTAGTPPLKIDTDNDGRRDTIVKQGDMGWFAGFAPKEDPRIAVAVVMEYVDRGGGSTAGPIARDVLEICKEFGYLEK